MIARVRQIKDKHKKSAKKKNTQETGRNEKINGSWVEGLLFLAQKELVFFLEMWIVFYGHL